MKDTARMLAAGTLGSLVAIALLWGVWAMADGDPATDTVPRYVPYQGTLEKDGVGVTGSLPMRFSLYDGDAEEPCWTETQTVGVYAGRFSVLLGASSVQSVQLLSARLQAADDLEMEVAVQSGVEWIQLANRQKFLPLPYTMWATSGSDLVVSQIDGLPNAPLGLNRNTGEAVNTGGDLLVGGQNISFEADEAAGDGGRALVHGEGDQLIINAGTDFVGGTSIEGDTAIVGDTTITGNLDIGGVLNVDPGLIVFKKYSMGNSTSAGTSFSYNEWSCMIGGVLMQSGDIEEDGTHDPLYFYTSRNAATGNWQINADLVSESDDPESHTVGIVCFKAGLTDIQSWW